MPRKQLQMRRHHLEDLPEIEIPQGYEMRTYRKGDEADWARITNASLGGNRSAEDAREGLTSKPEFMPDGLFFITHNGELVGTCCAYRLSAEETAEGYLHMLGVLPEHQGKRLGKALVAAVLHYFRDHGFRRAILHTDDFRIPAIRSYLRAGFQPDLRPEDETQPARWEVVMNRIRRLKEE